MVKAGSRKLKADRFRAGFTLLEITIVVGIMVLIVTAVVPQVGDLAQVQLRSSARRLAGTIRHTYFVAALTKKHLILNYDLDKNEYWVGEAVYNPELKAIEQVAIERGIGKKRVLPEGVRFAEIEGAGRPARTKGMDLTEFAPFGMATPTTIILRDRKNRDLRLEIPPYGGRVKVGAK